MIEGWRDELATREEIVEQTAAVIVQQMNQIRDMEELLEQVQDYCMRGRMGDNTDRFCLEAINDLINSFAART